MRWCVAVFALVAVATPAAAQSTYVGASLVGDVARYSKIDYDDSPRILTAPSSGDAEALGFSVRVGRALGARWGLEFEFARSGEMESRSPQVVFPAEWRLDPQLPSRPVADFQIDVEQEQRHLGLGALAWFRQDLGRRVDLSFLGGLLFSRWETEQDYDVSIARPAIYPPIPSSFRTITYDISPAIGAEAAVKVGETTALTAGVRLQGTAPRSGWLVRPSAGFRWTF